MVKDPFLEHRVMTADPVELIQMLYDRALRSTREARASLKGGDIPTRSVEICRTIAILVELEGSLDHSAGGSLSQNLGKLYHYMRTRLTQGNIEQVDGPLAEVESLLKTLGEGWSAICLARKTAAAVEATGTPYSQPAETAYSMMAMASVTAVYGSDLGSSSQSWTA